MHQQTKNASISNKSGNWLTNILEINYGRSSGKNTTATTNTAGAATGVANPKSPTTAKINNKKRLVGALLNMKRLINAKKCIAVRTLHIHTVVFAYGNM